MNTQLSQVMLEMVAYDRGDALRIQHFVKVHNFAALIGVTEQLDPETQLILETAAILHDIGIHPSELKYGSSAGHYQEIEGPAEAEAILRRVGGYTEAQIDRVKFLIAHHHTYHDIQGMDYQILIEADFLVNLFENSSRYDAAKNVRERIFKTQAGIQMLEDMFLSEKWLIPDSAWTMK